MMHTDIGKLKLRGARLLVERPKPWESQERKIGDSGLYAPQQALHNSLGWAVKAKATRAS